MELLTLGFEDITGEEQIVNSVMRSLKTVDTCEWNLKIVQVGKTANGGKAANW